MLGHPENDNYAYKKPVNGSNSIVKYIFLVQASKDSPITGLHLLDSNQRSIVSIGDTDVEQEEENTQNVRGGFYFYELRLNEILIDVRLCE